MTEGDLETFPGGNGWHNRIKGSGVVLSSHETKDAAQEAGRKYATEHQVQHIILNLDGLMSERHSYDNSADNSSPP